nr:uncharacterized protein LOC128686706 [Cherax quadricarinatus]
MKIIKVIPPWLIFALGTTAGLLVSLGYAHGFLELIGDKIVNMEKFPAGDVSEGAGELLENARSHTAYDHQDWGNLNCTLPRLNNPDEFYAYIYNRQLPCDKPVMVGGELKSHPPYMVGEKWVCMSKTYNIVPGRCIVLSFGILQDFSFDDDMDQRFNCKVYAFDPTIGRETHRRSPNIMFYDLGISHSDDEINTTKLARYETILKKLGHENSTIDYLKIDVEGAELGFFQDVFTNTPNLLKNVKQIGMEIHNSYTNKMSEVREKYWKYFQLLDCFGFKLMFSEINPVHNLRFLFRGQARSCCYELVWARARQW